MQPCKVLELEGWHLALSEASKISKLGVLIEIAKGCGHVEIL